MSKSRRRRSHWVALVVSVLFQSNSLSGEQSTEKSAISDIHRVDTPAKSLLNALTHVKSVAASPSGKQITHRIIHIRNWHFLPKSLFAAEYSRKNVDDAYHRFLEDVEDVQREQIALLRQLIRKHGLKSVYYEGLTDEQLPVFRATIVSLRATKKSIPEIEKNIQEMDRYIVELQMSDKEDNAALRNANRIKQKLNRVLTNYRHDLLQIGAAGRLMMTGELKEVCPLDTDAQLARSNPLNSNGSLKRVQRSVNEAREDSQVRCLLKSPGTAVVILGGAHDLSDNIRRLSNRKCQYVRVTTNKFLELSAK